MAIEGSRRYLDQQSTQYNQSLRKLLHLISFERDVCDRVYGPKYYTTTKSGTPLVISTYSYTRILPYTFSREGTLVAIAQEEESGEIVGHITNALVNYSSKPDELHATGEITIGRRGEGIAIPLNLAFIDVLQRIANQGKPVNWWKCNDNLKMLRRYRKRYENSSDEEERELLQQLEVEQQRWLSIYGAEGTLGINQISELEGDRIFSPQPHTGTFGIDRVSRVSFNSNLIEKGSRKIYEMDILEEEPANDLESHRISREEELKLVFAPVIKIRIGLNT